LRESFILKGSFAQEIAEKAERESRLVSSWENQAVDSVFEDEFAIVDQKSEWDIEEPHVAQKLGLVDGEDLLDALVFNEDAAIDQQVKAQRLFERDSLVFDPDDPLRLMAHTP
jgi:hypothetical protein